MQGVNGSSVAPLSLRTISQICMEPSNTSGDFWKRLPRLFTPGRIQAGMQNDSDFVGSGGHAAIG